MNTDKDALLTLLYQLRRLLERIITLRVQEIAAAKYRGFNPDDNTRKEED